MTFKINTPPSAPPSRGGASFSDAVSALAAARSDGYDIRRDILARRAGFSQILLCKCGEAVDAEGEDSKCCSA